MIRRIIFVLIVLVISGCTQSKEYSIYNPDNFYRVGNKEPITFPADIKLRKAQSAEYYLPKSNGLPKPIPSILPPDSEALKVYLKDEDRLDMPYYERFPIYSMTKEPIDVKDTLDLNYYEKQPVYPMPK